MRILRFKLYSYRPFLAVVICLILNNMAYSQTRINSEGNKNQNADFEYFFNFSLKKSKGNFPTWNTKKCKQVKYMNGISSCSYVQTNDLKIKKIHFNNIGYFHSDTLYNQIYNQVLKNQIQNIEVLEINENCANLPVFISEFKNLKSLQLRLFENDGCEGLDYNIFYSTLFLNKLFTDLSDEIQYLKINKLGGNIFIPENCIRKLKNIQSLEISTNIYDASVITNIPVSLLLNKEIKILDIEQNHFNIIETGLFTNQTSTNTQYCNLCFKQNRKQIDRANKLDTIIFRDLEQKIYATGKVNDENLAEGKWLFYHKNGTIAEERYYKQGVEVGEWLMYDEQGNRVGHYEFKKDTTICTYYKSTGGLGYQYILFNNYTDGIYKRWNDVGVLVTEKRYKSLRFE